MVNVAIVGLGWWGKRLSKTLSGNPLLRIVPGVEPDRAALHGFSESRGFPSPAISTLQSLIPMSMP